jgi:hypothetical protein
MTTHLDVVTAAAKDGLGCVHRVKLMNYELQAIKGLPADFN